MAPTSRLMQPAPPHPRHLHLPVHPPPAACPSHRTILPEGTCPTGEGTCKTITCRVIIYGGLYVYRGI